jgi:hypothetical protein
MLWFLDPEKTYSGSRGKRGTGSRIRIRHTDRAIQSRCALKTDLLLVSSVCLLIIYSTLTSPARQADAFPAHRVTARGVLCIITMLYLMGKARGHNVTGKRL